MTIEAHLIPQNDFSGGLRISFLTLFVVTPLNRNNVFFSFPISDISSFPISPMFSNLHLSNLDLNI